MQLKLREFTKACSENLPEIPNEMTPSDILFIKEMVNDELDELEVAKTIGEQADALVDAVIYIFDMANRKGINLMPIFDIVHNANMKKVVNGKVIRRPDGKILKPEGWQKPDDLIEDEIINQLTFGSFK